MSLNYNKNQPYQGTPTIADGAITDAKLGSDVKVGSLAALTTSVKTSIQAAINELVASIATLSDNIGTLTTSVAGKLTGQTDYTVFSKEFTLGTANPTTINFSDAETAATILGTLSEPFALTDGNTFVVNADSAGDDTATWNATAGTSVSNTTPSTDMTGEVDTKLNIAIDGGDATEVTFDWTACNSGAAIATQIQTAIRALAGGIGTGITCAFGDDKYTITSATKGTGSAIVITPSANGSCTEELKLGVAGGGTETAGTGDAVNIAATTAQEICDVINADIAAVTATVEGGKVRITSKTVGNESSLAVNAGCAVDTIIGITGTAAGTLSFENDKDMADTDYNICITQIGTDIPNYTNIMAGTKATGSFAVLRGVADDVTVGQAYAPVAGDVINITVIGKKAP